MRILIYLFFLILIMTVGCSTPEETVKRNVEDYTEVKKVRNEVNLNIEQNVSWINRMPGSQPKFHVSGKFTLLEADEYNRDLLELKYIKIYQNEEEIYYIIPKVIERTESTGKNITFSTIKGLTIHDDLDRESPVMFELIFMQDKDEFKYRINDVKVEEVF